MVSNFTAVFDACVLYPAPLRSFLMYLALTDMFRAKWTAEMDSRNSRRVDAKCRKRLWGHQPKTVRTETVHGTFFVS